MALLLGLSLSISTGLGGNRHTGLSGRARKKKATPDSDSLGADPLLTAILAVLLNKNNFTKHQHQTRPPSDYDGGRKKQGHSINMSMHRLKTTTPCKLQ